MFTSFGTSGGRRSGRGALLLMALLVAAEVLLGPDAILAAEPLNAPTDGLSSTWATAGWLAVYTAIVIASSLFGGWIPGRVTLTHARIQHVISFVAGLMLGIALLHLLPHAITMGARVSVDLVIGFVLIGILTMFLLLRAFHFHVHEPEALVSETDEGPSTLVVEHDCSSPGHSHRVYGHGHEPHGEQPKQVSGSHRDGDREHGRESGEPGAGFGWAGVFFGLAVHTLIDGVALGAAMTAELSHNAAAILPGVGILAAIALHKPLDSMSITSLMAVDGWSRSAQNLVNICFALLCPVGAGLFVLGMSVGSEAFVACSLAFSAGVFLCVALSDLLPEMEFHTHDRVTLSAALAIGVVLAWAMRLLEPGHFHG